MTFTYNLPGDNNEPDTHETTKNAVIIIGANGAGKSHLGAWMEKQAEIDHVHRIGGQRKLNFNANISLKSYTEATNLVLYGNSSNKQKHLYRWNQGGEHTTTLLTDFEYALAAMIALKNKEQDDFVQACKTAEREKNTILQRQRLLLIN